MGTETFVDKLPKCNFCKEEAFYDGRTVMGPWANMCMLHFGQYGTGLGTGRGQKLVVRPVTVIEAEPDLFEQPDTSNVAFETWMQKVNRAIESSVGLSAYDLADANYYGWFEGGMKPSEAAAEVVAAEMGEMGFDW